MAHDTYLTADYKVEVENNNIDDYGREGCKASKDVNLATTEISSWRQVCSVKRMAYHYIPRKSVGRSDALVSHPTPRQGK